MGCMCGECDYIRMIADIEESHDGMLAICNNPKSPEYKKKVFLGFDSCDAGMISEDEAQEERT